MVEADKRKVCIHFTAGKCSRGASCRFSHEAPSVTSTCNVVAKVSRKRKRPGKQWRDRKAEAEKGTPEETANVVNVGKDVDIPTCRGHKTPCLLRKVLKQGKNFGREYWICAWSGEAGRRRCGFFLWADNKQKRRSGEDGKTKKRLRSQKAHSA